MEHVFPPQQFYGSHNENLMYFSLYLKVRCFLFQCILYISAFLLYGVIGMNECQVYFFFFFFLVLAKYNPSLILKLMCAII